MEEQQFNDFELDIKVRESEVVFVGRLRASTIPTKQLLIHDPLINRMGVKLGDLRSCGVAELSRMSAAVLRGDSSLTPPPMLTAHTPK